MATPEGSCVAAVATNETAERALGEKSAVRGEVIADAWAESSAAESAAGLAVSGWPITGAGGAVDPVSATRYAYWPARGRSAESAPLSDESRPRPMTVQRCAASS